jgi:hypothetical protein
VRLYFYTVLLSGVNNHFLGVNSVLFNTGFMVLNRVNKKIITTCLISLLQAVVTAFVTMYLQMGEAAINFLGN